MLKSMSKISFSLLRQVLVLSACLVFLMGPYLQAIQLTGGKSISDCCCSSRCACPETIAQSIQLPGEIGAKGCGCDMDRGTESTGTPLDVQTPDNRPSDGFNAGLKADHKTASGDIAVSTVASIPAPTTFGPPIYIAVSSLLI